MHECENRKRRAEEMKVRGNRESARGEGEGREETVEKDRGREMKGGRGEEEAGGREGGKREGERGGREGGRAGRKGGKESGEEGRAGERGRMEGVGKGSGQSDLLVDVSVVALDDVAVADVALDRELDGLLGLPRRLVHYGVSLVAKKSEVIPNTPIIGGGSPLWAT